MFMLLDVNTEIYPFNKDEKFLMALSPSLNLNTQDGLVSIQDKFEYIMCGRLYKIADGGSSNPGLKVDIYASFGGLQMMLKGDASHCVKFGLDRNLLLLIRKL
ncbi:DNA-directed RNA polymerases II and V subunit 8A [Quillaja saponaria]|nr:DNA-directed RNA polymerases II and V subunit 8A [Quillaja saponaria]